MPLAPELIDAATFTSVRIISGAVTLGFVLRNAKRDLGKFDKSEQLLFRLLAARGMRLSEVFEIGGENIERGFFRVSDRKGEAEHGEI
jgi:hypothetical protein